MYSIEEQMQQLHDEEVKKNQVNIPSPRKSSTQKVEAEKESFSSTSTYSGICAQDGSYETISNGNPEILPNGERYNGEISIETLKKASKTGALPNNNWIRTADEILNPAIRAGYYHSSFVITSTYRPNGSNNHRSLGAIDISMAYTESKDQLLANLAEGIIKLGLPFDKLLLETDGSKTSAWIHVQAAKDPSNPRRLVLTCKNASCTINNGGGGIDLNYLRG